jgi:hypothetical protein
MPTKIIICLDGDQLNTRCYGIGCALSTLRIDVETRIYITANITKKLACQMK